MEKYQYGKDYPFAAFITNLGKYNEGELVGKWVKFPCSEEDFSEALKEIGIGSVDSFGCFYEEWFITDYDCYVSGLYDHLGEYSSFDNLNELAEFFEELSEDEITIFSDALELSTFQEVIENFEDYKTRYIPEVSSHEELGEFLVDEGYIEVPDNLLPYFDFEKYGRDCSFDGYFTANGFFWNY